MRALRHNLDLLWPVLLVKETGIHGKKPQTYCKSLTKFIT